MKREEAILVLKELLDCCSGLDCHSLELVPTISSEAKSGWYQIIIRGTLDLENKKLIQDILDRRQLSWQIGSMWRTKQSANKGDPDTFIIYRAKGRTLQR